MIDLLVIVIYVLAVLAAVSFHEMAHALVAFYLGDRRQDLKDRISLNPFKHSDPLLSIGLPIVLAIFGLPVFGVAKPVQINKARLRWGEYGNALVALAGPLTNFVLAFVAFGFCRVSLETGHLFVAEILKVFFSVNLGFMLFNLLPIPPLDGSRVIYVLAPDVVRDFLNKIEQYGFLVIMILVFAANNAVVFYIGSVSRIIIGMFNCIFGSC